jgi:HAD domain in Swiss Army Knife RNA repair proteins
MGIKMKVVMLDFDGVLIPFGKSSLNDEATKTAVGNMRKFFEKNPDVKIVISSAWRRHGMSYCKRFLDGLGLPGDRIVGLTGEERGDRGYQIECYLKRHPEVEKFVIVDDNSDMPTMLNKLVKTNSFIGFTEADIEKASQILNS